MKILKAVSDRNRLRILKILQQRENCCVCEIQHVLGVGQPTTSRHLKILEEAGLVISLREGKWINYHLASRSGEGKVQEILALLLSWLNGDPEFLRDSQELKKSDRNVLCSQG